MKIQSHIELTIGLWEEIESELVNLWVCCLGMNVQGNRPNRARS